MKRIFACFMCIYVLFAFVGCSKQEEPVAKELTIEEKLIAQEWIFTDTSGEIVHMTFQDDNIVFLFNSLVNMKYKWKLEKDELFFISESGEVEYTYSINNDKETNGFLLTFIKTKSKKGRGFSFHSGYYEAEIKLSSGKN